MTRNDAIDIMKDAGFGFLATIENGKPCVRPMMPYLTEDGELLLALLGRSRTIQQIKNNPKIEFCFVDRKMSYCRISGDGYISEDLEKKDMVFQGIPMLRQYFSEPSDPNFKLIVISIQQIEAMTAHDAQPIIFTE